MGVLEKIIGEALEEFLNEKENDGELVRVGRISKELQEQFNQVRHEHEAEHDAIKDKIDAFIQEVQREHDCEKFHDRNQELWEKVYDELGLTEEERGKHYTIKNAARVVYRQEKSKRKFKVRANGLN